jgi:hypothetical protein
MIDGSEIKVFAKATDNSESANVGYSEMVTVLIKYPKVKIDYTGTLLQPGDILDVKVNVMNTRMGNMELYAACLNSGFLYWFPLWNDSPRPTTVERGLWEESILRIPYAFRPTGTFIFYAAIVDTGSLDIVDLTSLEFRLK